MSVQDFVDDNVKWGLQHRHLTDLEVSKIIKVTINKSGCLYVTGCQNIHLR
jgi:hypothetical protein